MSEKCQSYRANAKICADGFVQKPFCRGSFGCHACGHVSNREIPACLKDEIPYHLCRDDGSSIFYQGAKP